MLEKEIEKKVCDYAKTKYGALCYKFTSPQRRSVPDRMIIFPSGLLVFIEFKAQGKKPTPAQEREIGRLTEFKQEVLVCDNVIQGQRAIDFMVKLKS